MAIPALIKAKCDITISFKSVCAFTFHGQTYKIYPDLSLRVTNKFICHV
jgi:hypothetical protein